MIKHLFLSILLSIILSPVFGGSFEYGLVCYRNHNYKPALKSFLLAAKQNDPRAQHYIGRMYLQGDEVTQSIEEGMKWLLLAAKQNHALIQLELGSMYLFGYGILAEDYNEALKWLLMVFNRTDIPDDILIDAKNCIEVAYKRMKEQNCSTFEN